MRIDAHVQDICRKVYTDIRCISSIRHLLSIDATKTLLSAVVLPKLHYCNSFFYGSPMYMLERSHKVLNSAARLIFQCRKQNHISPLFSSQLSVILSFWACLLFTCLIYSECTIIIIIMVIFKCYFSGEHIALSIKTKQNNNGVNIE